MTNTDHSTAVSGAETSVVVSLLPCPFCGGEGEASGTTGTIYVACTDCNAFGSTRIATEDAIAAWNTRLTSPQAASAIPDGWRLVPVKPTEAMQDAWNEAFWRKQGDCMSVTPTEHYADGGGPFGYGFRAMLAASPESPQAASAEVREDLPPGYIEALARCAGREVAARNGGPRINGNIQSAAVAGARSALKALAAVPAHAPSGAGEVDTRRASRLNGFRQAVGAVPYIAEKIASGAQFNAFDDGSNDDDDADEDCSMHICIGPVTDARLVASVEGRAKANMIADALTFAALAAATTGNADAESGS